MADLEQRLQANAAAQQAAGGGSAASALEELNALKLQLDLETKEQHRTSIMLKMQMEQLERLSGAHKELSNLQEGGLGGGLSMTTLAHEAKVRARKGHFRFDFHWPQNAFYLTPGAHRQRHKRDHLEVHRWAQIAPASRAYPPPPTARYSAR